MIRILQIIGMSLALLIIGGVLTIVAVGGITHKRLNATGIAMLIGNAYAVQFIFRELRQKIRERPSSTTPVDSN
jgi:hypothetical protein